MAFTKPKLDFWWVHNYHVSTEVLIYSFQIQVGSVAAHTQHAFRSVPTNTQLTLPKTLRFPGYSPFVIQLWGISQKASYFHFQLRRDESQAFDGKTKTYTFLPLSQSSLVGLAKASLLLWDREKRTASLPCCTLRDKDRIAWLPQYPLSHRVWCSSKLFVYPCIQWPPVQYPWLMSCSNQTIQKRKQGCSGGQGQTDSCHRFPILVLQLLIKAPDFHAQHESQSIYPSS